MRRSEFEIDNKSQILTLLSECDHGTLSLIDTQGLPYGVPVNFVWWEEGIAFHGSKEGKKMHLLAQNPMASFNAVKSYALIPSYFSKTRSACPATQFFGSVTIAGTVECIESLDAKASALNALMQKLQPENGYDPIDVTSPMYKKMIEQTGLFCLIPESISLKLKAGQNLTEERKALLIEKLTQRGEEIDLLSVKMIHQATIR